MADWTYSLSDGSGGTLDAADLSSATAAAAAIAGDSDVLLVRLVEPPASPPIVTSPNGTPFAIVVDDAGIATATPVNPDPPVEG